ncbi:sugar-binding protein [Chthonomonas calidirosea]|nr:sugar-binding protein [Chthonomonas calidirosea]
MALDALSQQTNNYELRAVPAPGKVVIDGKLNDWDLSGKILICYDVRRLINSHSAIAAAMYDKNYLYFAFHIKDKSPMVNHIDPNTQPGEGWKSDCVQIRLQSDRICHITAWYFTDRKQPCMQIHYGMWDKSDPDYADLNDALSRGAKEAFLKDTDGNGYTQELAIPWKLITKSGKPPKPGDVWRLGLEIFWGSPSGKDWPELRYADVVNPQRMQREFFWTTPEAWGSLRFMAKGNLSPSSSLQLLSDAERLEKMEYSTRGPVAIKYYLPFDAGVTLVIEKPDGTRVKNLISDYPRKKGYNIDYWDGTDDNGKLVGPGEYRVRGLYHAPLDIRYEFAYGNPGNPPYDNSTGTGGWLSNHADPFAITTDQEGVYVACPYAEGACAVMKMDYKGQRQWGIPGISAGPLAVQNGYLYVLLGGAHPSTIWGIPENEVAIRRIDARTGKFAPWSDGKDTHAIATLPPIEKWWKPRRPEGEVVATHGFNADWCQRQTMGLAIGGGKLYASLYYENKIIVVNLDEGKAIGEIAIERPAGLACDKAGRLYAISGKRVVRIEENGNISPIVTSGLSAPVGLALDSMGNLYVSDWGDAMCVKKFSPEGQLLLTIGKLGGRPLNGPYDPEGMFRPFELAVDAEGRLWVAEYDSSPRRISVWDTQTGKFLKEFCGTTHYGSMGAFINRLNPRMAFVLGNICELNWDKGLWRVIGTLHRPAAPNDLFHLDPDPFANLRMEVINYKGRKLLIANDSFTTIIAELHDTYAKPLCAMGSLIELYRTGEEWPDIILKNLVDDPKRLEELKRKYPRAFNGLDPLFGPDVYYMLAEPDVRSMYLWIDKNGNGLVDEGEMRFFRKDELGGMRLWGRGWQTAYDGELNLYFSGKSKDGKRLQLWCLPLKGWNEVGAPIYDPHDAKKIVDMPVAGFPDSFSWADKEGKVLLGENPMMLFSPEGKLLWSYPNPWPGEHGAFTAPHSKRGRVIGPLFVCGSVEVGHGVGEVFALRGVMGETYFMTIDGLYIANLFQDARGAPDALPDEPRRGMSIKDCTAGGEPFNGNFFQNPIDGHYYLEGPVGSCREASVVARVMGLANIHRLTTQRIIFSRADYAKAEKLFRERAKEEAQRRTLAITRMKKAIEGVPSYDDFDWSDPRVASWSYDMNHSVERATWSYDDKNLYIAFQGVADDTPMINNGQDWQLLFKTGDALLFELRTTPDNDSPNVLPGDIRLLFSVFHGEPIAVLYNYKVPGTTQPYRFSSPVGTTLIDQVEILKDAKVVFDRGSDNYSARIVIPLADIGFKPEKGKYYRGDFGVIYSDKLGKTDELRMFWSNPLGAMISDVFSESQINPSYWGKFQVEE